MTKTNSYQNFAAIYDAITDPDINFLFFLDRALKGRKKIKILDFGCGTGKFTIPLAEKGFQVYGLDFSTEMIALAKKKACAQKQKIKFYAGDITQKKLNQKFEVIVSSDCLNHLLTEKKLVNVFKAIHKLLKGKGEFIFDLSTKKYFQGQVDQEFYGGKAKNKFFVWDDCMKGDIFKINLHVFVKQKKDIFQKQQESILQRAYSVKQIKKALKQAGFYSAKAYGDEFTRPKKSDERIYFIAKK